VTSFIHKNGARTTVTDSGVVIRTTDGAILGAIKSAGINGFTYTTSGSPATYRASGYTIAVGYMAGSPIVQVA